MKTLIKQTIAVVALAAFVSTSASAQNGGVAAITKLDTSFNFGPIAVSLQTTNPVQDQTGMFQSTLHVEVRDDTQTPPLNGQIDAVGRAPDVVTLLGGFLAAAIQVEKDLQAGVTFAQAVTDAQAKTGVTIISFRDPTAVEYAVTLALIITVWVINLTARISTPAGPELTAILNKMISALAAIGVLPPATIVP